MKLYFFANIYLSSTLICQHPDSCRKQSLSALLEPDQFQEKFNFPNSDKREANKKCNLKLLILQTKMIHK